MKPQYPVNPNAWQEEKFGYSQLHREFEASLGSMSTCLQTKIEVKTVRRLQLSGRGPPQDGQLERDGDTERLKSFLYLALCLSLQFPPPSHVLGD